MDYYESKGWKVGNAPMKDWKASVRLWERKDDLQAVRPPKTDYRPYRNPFLDMLNEMGDDNS